MLNAAKVVGFFLETAATIASNPLVGGLLKIYTNVLLVNAAFTLLGGRALVGLVAGIGAAIARFIALNTAMAAMQRTTAVTSSSLAGTQLQMALLTRNAGAAIGPINMLKGALMGLARLAIIPIAIEVIVNGMAELDRLKKSLDEIAGFSSKEYKKEVKGLSKEQVNSRIIVNRRTQKDINKELAQYTYNGLGALKGLFTGRDEELRARQTMVGTKGAVLSGARGNLTQKQLDERRYGSTGTVAPISGGGSGDSKKEKEKKERESQAAQLKLDLELSKEQFALDLQMINAQLTANVIEQNRIEGAKEILDLQYQIKGVKLEQIPEDEKQLKIAKLQGAIEAARAQSNAKLVLAMTQETKAIEENIKKTVQGYQQELQEKQRYAELLSQGVAPALAKVYIEIERAFKEQKEQLKVQIGIAETAIIELEAKKDLTDEEKKRLGVLKDQLKAKKDLLGDADKGEKDSKGAAAQIQTPPSISTTLTEGLDAARQKLADLMDVGKLLVGTAGAIGDAFGNAFKGLIDGSMTAQQAFASLFQNVANYFTDMVAQMIAEWLKAQLIQGFLNIIGAILPGFGTGIAPGPVAKSAGVKFNPAKMGPAFANGGIAQGGFRAFASGGIVTGPTLGLVGEGRYNEAVIPLPDGKSVPVDLGGMGGAGNQITSNIVVNVNSDGQSQSQQSGTGNAELGRKIEGAVKQVIVGELRPGGLLAGRR